MIHMYGINNCDTVKKARKWLQDNDVAYEFHDYKKQGVDATQLQDWCAKVGWEVLLNKRGTTWRKLSDSDKEGIDQDKCMSLLLAHTSMIKRPVLVLDDKHVEVGFSVARYMELFKA